MSSPFAHLPYVPPEGRYRLGSGLATAPDDFWWNTTHDDGTHTICAEPEGWEGVQFVTPIDTVGGRDGGLDGPGSIAPRVLPIQGMMVAGDTGTLHRKIRALRGKLGPRRRVVWDQYDFGVDARMGLVCRAQGDFKAGKVKGNELGGVCCVVTFTLVASNPPWKWGTDPLDAPIDIGLPVADVTGRTYNKTYPYNYGAVTNPGGVGTAVNRGDIDSFPIFEITGPVDNPVITNETTGRSFMVSGVIASGQTVTVDARSGNVTPSSFRLVGRPFVLVPGSNRIRWRASSGSFNPNANLRVIWRSTWE